MNPITGILVIVDPTSETQPAVAKGALLAEKFNARLELLVCDTKAARQARTAAHARANAGEPPQAEMKSMLESLAEPLRARGMDVTTESTWGEPLHEALVERTRKTCAGLVIKDTHHHTLAQRTFLTNTDWQLIRGCPVPLLLTKPKPWPQGLRIAAAIDPGHTNDKAVLLDRCILDLAAAFAARLGGELHALHVYVPTAVAVTATAMPPIPAAVSPQSLEYERDAKWREVLALVSAYGVSSDNLHLELGGPAEALPRCAAEIGADVVALGAVSRSGLKRVFIGSTAEDVLEHLPCDALIVKTPDFAQVMPF